MDAISPRQQTEAPPPWLDRVRQEQVASLYNNLFLGMSATWLAASVLVWVLYQERAASVATLMTWLTLITLLTLSRFVLSWFYRRAADARTKWRKWATWFTAGAITSGFVWGVGSVLMMSPARFDLQLLVVVVLSAVVYGSLAAFGRWMPAFFGFFVPAMAPSALWSLTQGDTPHLAYGVLAAIWMPAMAVLALRFHEGSVKAMALGFENAALSEGLRRQKSLAEEANSAKTRFLAAASHDLRQPVHALTLFVGALRNEKLEPSAAHLAEQIDVATSSLDELFTSLLDVSRLDAGVVRPELRPVALQPMLERLVDEMRPGAVAKSIELRLKARDVWIESDPVMLERIMRNLLANAVRYTSKGGVLVAVRVADSSAAIEVWDTGSGIPEALQAEVFREFYQVNRKDSEGGLGLGLAIVQRLCALLHYPMELRSVMRRGTMFRVRAPTAAPERTDASTRTPTEITASNRALVWVIDDEAGPRAGMEALLTSWGYQVRAAVSEAEILRLFTVNPMPPSAILCDYRLGGESGIAVIASLRARLGANIPAALITGDTTPERLREAAESGLPILHKPAPKAKLRALIGNLTRAAAVIS